MPDYNEYQQRIIDAIERYGESFTISYRTTTWDNVRGEISQKHTESGYKAFIRPTDKTDWEHLPEGLKIKDIRKMYYMKKFPTKELIINRKLDGKQYEIVVPPIDNDFEGKNFYYKCYIAVKETQNDPD